MGINFHARLGETAEISNKGEGRIIHADTTPELFQKVGKEERLLTYRELLGARLEVFDDLARAIPDVLSVTDLIEATPAEEALPKELFEIMAEVRFQMWNDVKKFAIWMDRFTTSTSVVRGDDEKAHFWDYQITGKDISEAFDKGLQDGGFDYSKWMGRIKKESYASLDYPDYLNAYGGAYASEEWRDHPVFGRACSDEFKQNAYVRALDVLSSDRFHKPGRHSGWVQTGFPVGFGRPIALGFGEASFYPPNNATRNHAGVVVRR